MAAHTALVLAAAMAAAQPAAAEGDGPATPPQDVPDAAPASATPSWRGDVEANPVLFALGGYSLNVGVKPPWNVQARFTAGRLAVELPSFALGDNKGKGWHVTDRGYLLGTRFYFRRARGGLFAGAYVVYQQRDFVNDFEAGRATVHQFVGAAEGGYEWFPFDRNGFYLTLNMLIAYRFAEIGQPALGMSTFKEGKFLPLPGVYVGWEF